MVGNHSGEKSAGAILIGSTKTRYEARASQTGEGEHCDVLNVQGISLYWHPWPNATYLNEPQ